MSELIIPIPVHPEDAHLPLSFVQIKLPSGAVAQATFPIQGARTIDAMIAILEIWKPTLVFPHSEFSI